MCVVTTKLSVKVMVVTNTVAHLVCIVALWVDKALRDDFFMLPSMALIFPFDNDVQCFFSRTPRLTSLSEDKSSTVASFSAVGASLMTTFFFCLHLPLSFALPSPSPSSLCSPLSGQFPQPLSWTCLVSYGGPWSTSMLASP